MLYLHQLQWQRFFDLRRRTLEAIQKLMAEGDVCKPDEGRFTIEFPDYFEDQEHPDSCKITLDCYLLGPDRHYFWCGDTLSETIDKAEKDIEKYLSEIR